MFNVPNCQGFNKPLGGIAVVILKMLWYHPTCSNSVMIPENQADIGDLHSLHQGNSKNLNTSKSKGWFIYK